MTPSNDDIVKAVAQIEQHTTQPGQAMAPASVNPKDLCKTYNSIKGPLGILLPVIKLIPIYGTAVASGLQILMGIADKLCPTA